MHLSHSEKAILCESIPPYIYSLYIPDSDLGFGLFASDSSSCEDLGGLFPRLHLLLPKNYIEYGAIAVNLKITQKNCTSCTNLLERNQYS